MVTIEQAIELLKNGEVVAFPTETVYGLGADAWNPSAVKKVFEIKGRPADNPLIVHIADKASAGDFAAKIPEPAGRLMERFWPGPLTLIFGKRAEVLDLVTGGLDTVALRWPDHPLSQQLLAGTGPLVAPSANRSGRPSPTKAAHVREDFGEEFPVIDGGSTRIGLESTVLDLSSEPYTIHRPGAVGREEIEEAVGKAVATLHAGSEATQPRSPGTKYSHYAPSAGVRWMKKGEHADSRDTLYLLHGSNGDGSGNREVPANIIHYDRDYSRMANELYDRFRQADHYGYSSVAIEPLPETAGSGSERGILEALKNRIGKALG